MLIYEGVLYALSSAISALILSAVFCPLIGKLFERTFWFFSANFTMIPALIAIPVFLSLGWIIPTAIYKQSTKSNIIERLRNTE